MFQLAVIVIGIWCAVWLLGLAFELVIAFFEIVGAVGEGMLSMLDAIFSRKKKAPPEPEYDPNKSYNEQFPERYITPF